MDLRNWLEQRNPDLHRAVDNVRAAVKVIWERPLHRYYTDHSVEHSERVIEKLNGLTEELMSTDHLYPTEVNILLVAAYLHDIGMQYERFKNGDLEQIRDRHHELTRELICNNYFKQSDRTISLGLEGVPPDIVDVIASVAEAHRRTDLSQNKYNEFKRGNETIRPRLLAALLRLADELDIDYRRVRLELLDFMNVPIKSSFHWHLCYYVSGVQITDGLIMVWYRFPEGCEHYRNIIIPFVHNKIDAEFTELQQVFWEYGVKVEVGNKTSVRYVLGLERMSPEVKNIALERCKGRYEEEIIKYSEEIRLLESFRSLDY